MSSVTATTKYHAYIAGHFECFGKLYRLETPGDGSCLLHAICQACSGEYDAAPDKGRYIQRLRRSLAEKFSEAYPTLYDGALSDFGRSVDEFSQSTMTRILASHSWLGTGFLQFFSSFFGHRIFILSKETKSRYETDEYYFYPKTKSYLLLLYHNGHFETLGRRNGKFLETIFHDK